MGRNEIGAEGWKRDVLAEGKHPALEEDNMAALQWWKRSGRGKKHRPVEGKRGGGAKERQGLKFRRGLGVQWVCLCFAQGLAHLQHPRWCDLGQPDLGGPLSDPQFKIHLLQPSP